jgi:hypothetical protein
MPAPAITNLEGSCSGRRFYARDIGLLLTVLTVILCMLFVTAGSSFADGGCKQVCVKEGKKCVQYGQRCTHYNNQSRGIRISASDTARGAAYSTSRCVHSTSRSVHTISRPASRSRPTAYSSKRSVPSRITP